MAEKRRGLGRGLGALIPSSAKEDITAPETSATAEEGSQKSEARKKTSSTQVASRGAASSTAGRRQARKKTAETAPQESSQPEANPQAPAAEKKTLAQSATDTAQRKSAQNEKKSVQKPTEKVDSVLSSQNVSRETSKPTSKNSAARSSQKSQRMDMGAALRSTTATRRPVDFFFGEDSAEGNDKLVAVPGAEFAEVDVLDIHPNRKQPRSEFDEQDMEELVHSIKEIGVLQPIVIRPSREKGKEKYELVMGERRWRATQRAGLQKIPAIIRDTQDVDLLRDALLENLHRSQLNPIEEAAAYQQLLEEFGTTQDQLAQRIGRSRPQISNTLRLLKLPALVQRRVAVGVLSSGHARALLGLRSQAEIEKIAQKIVNEGLSVRAVEELVQTASESPAKERKAPQPQKHHERLDYIADAFADKLDTNVKIQLGSRKGKMTIEFASVEDLNRIISVLDPQMDK